MNGSASINVRAFATVRCADLRRHLVGTAGLHQVVYSPLIRTYVVGQVAAEHARAAGASPTRYAATRSRRPSSAVAPRRRAPRRARSTPAAITPPLGHLRRRRSTRRARRGSNATPAAPAACRIRPGFGSPPNAAVFTSGESATARAIARASSSSSAPSTSTTSTWSDALAVGDQLTDEGIRHAVRSQRPARPIGRATEGHRLAATPHRSPAGARCRSCDVDASTVNDVEARLHYSSASRADPSVATAASVVRKASIVARFGRDHAHALRAAAHPEPAGLRRGPLVHRVRRHDRARERLAAGASSNAVTARARPASSRSRWSGSPITPVEQGTIASASSPSDGGRRRGDGRGIGVASLAGRGVGLSAVDDAPPAALRGRAAPGRVVTGAACTRFVVNNAGHRRAGPPHQQPEVGQPARLEPGRHARRDEPAREGDAHGYTASGGERRSPRRDRRPGSCSGSPDRRRP